MSLATSPQEGDQVVDTDGAKLFLDGEAARVLDDKSLDAAVDSNGAVQFEVAEQPG
jgi:Fe-S cluster assembly iron-binding protein IscA